jgi:hypothetical protein
MEAVTRSELERARFTGREDAREKLERHLASQRRLLAEIERERDLPAHARKAFTTTDPNWLIGYFEHCLRWIDCAPDGANHLVAPMQGRYGVPLGAQLNYGVGPGEAMRRATERHHRERTGESKPWIEILRERFEALDADSLALMAERDAKVRALIADAYGAAV